MHGYSLLTTHALTTVNQSQNHALTTVNGSQGQRLTKSRGITTLASKKINVDNVCVLVEKYYPDNFTQHVITELQYQLGLFNVERKTNNNVTVIV